MQALRVVEPEEDDHTARVARVVPLFRGEQQGVSPLQMFGADWIDKRECARRLGRSVSWVERRMRSANPIPHKKLDPGVKQSSVMFHWPRVAVWWDALGRNV